MMMTTIMMFTGMVTAVFACETVLDMSMSLGATSIITTVMEFASIPQVGINDKFKALRA